MCTATVYPAQSECTLHTVLSFVLVEFNTVALNHFTSSNCRGSLLLQEGGGVVNIVRCNRKGIRFLLKELALHGTVNTCRTRHHDSTVCYVNDRFKF